ncbi:polysaccharide pyruvyl transferase family protein [Parabacteroides sp.]|uniref:polysaccharide pyruvyl transferase family protein n=1 Tax=Parabacteroides sp. TaxID=1869337 RepID=UPI00257C5E49|nr:polysaccharide pyruvyl transferase family protein [Parabacteroides sp.]
MDNRKRTMAFQEKSLEMKKIGIITYHYYYNYGTMLQAYALQEAIDRTGADARLINFRKPYYIPTFWFRMKRIPAYLLDFKRVWRLMRFSRRLDQKICAFDTFALNYFKQSETVYRVFDDFDKVDELYDLFVTGSDQTFSPKIGLNPCIFLDFVKDKDKKMAYAPSIGTVKFSMEELEEFKTYINKYKYLSCREASGAEFMQKLTGKNVETVLDPTFLLNKDDWSKIASKPIINEPYIFCYFLGYRKHYDGVVKYLQKKTGYKVFYIPIDYHDMVTSKELLFDCGPAEWLSLIKNAAVICTDSFHGMCFSINFQKDFYVLNKCVGGINSGDNSRIYDLLNRIGLLDRFVDVDTKIEFCHVDYLKPNELLQEESLKSIAYLNKILS